MIIQTKFNVNADAEIAKPQVFIFASTCLPVLEIHEDLLYLVIYIYRNYYFTDIPNVSDITVLGNPDLRSPNHYAMEHELILLKYFFIIMQWSIFYIKGSDKSASSLGTVQ